MDARDFDYGIGDDIDTALQQLRAEIAAQIRRAASNDIDAPTSVRLAYERAVLIAEGALRVSAPSLAW
jgi:hypothetical protein